jgi:hypothetical protein
MAAIAMASLFSSCGDDRDEVIPEPAPTPTPEEPADKTITITYAINSTADLDRNVKSLASSTSDATYILDVKNNLSADSADFANTFIPAQKIQNEKIKLQFNGHGAQPAGLSSIVIPFQLWEESGKLPLGRNDVGLGYLAQSKEDSIKYASCGFTLQVNNASGRYADIIIELPSKKQLAEKIQAATSAGAENPSSVIGIKVNCDLPLNASDMAELQRQLGKSENIIFVKGSGFARPAENNVSATGEILKKIAPAMTTGDLRFFVSGADGAKLVAGEAIDFNTDTISFSRIERGEKNLNPSELILDHKNMDARFLDEIAKKAHGTVYMVQSQGFFFGNSFANFSRNHASMTADLSKIGFAQEIYGETAITDEFIMKYMAKPFFVRGCLTVSSVDLRDGILDDYGNSDEPKHNTGSGILQIIQQTQQINKILEEQKLLDEYEKGGIRISSAPSSGVISVRFSTAPYYLSYYTKGKYFNEDTYSLSINTILDLRKDISVSDNIFMRIETPKRVIVADDWTIRKDREQLDLILKSDKDIISWFLNKGFDINPIAEPILKSGYNFIIMSGWAKQTQIR